MPKWKRKLYSKPSLDFVFYISNDTDYLKTKLLAPVAPIMSITKRDQVANKVLKTAIIPEIEGSVFSR